MKHALRLLVAGCGATLLCSPASATEFSIQPSIVVASPGAVGDAFDVVLTNNGASSITVGTFAFEVSVTDPDITFVGADFSTSAAPYIFAGQSVDETFSLPLLTSNTGQTLDASDSFFPFGSGATLTPGESLALGEVLFDVSPTAAPGSFAVSFTGTPSVADANNLSDPTGAPIGVDTFTPGSIDVVSSPEPSSIFLVLTGAAALALSIRRRRRT
ncbi:MAG TPA: PEP-CTERM sorting domain-containing protein [Bryobacteraceae bacterium]|jgi:hypothetical protein|nr:PEP-CTERM sorting domain-containing protein [Bryobacteraceae bacterium]